MNTSCDIHITGGVCIKYGATKHDIMSLSIEPIGSLYVPTQFGGQGEFFISSLVIDVLFFVQDSFEISSNGVFIYPHSNGIFIYPRG